jgi:hypothetical protein
MAELEIDLCYRSCTCIYFVSMGLGYLRTAVLVAELGTNLWQRSSIYTVSMV